jgi:hypothetical protein
MSGGGSLHKKDWLKIAGGLALGGTGLGLAGIGPLAGLLGGASAAGTGASAGLLGTLGSMGPEQAGILAAQNAGLGLGADAATLSAANTAGGGAATLGAKLGVGLDKLGMVGKAFQTAQAANGLLAPQQAPMQMGGKPPQNNAPIIGQTQDMPPKTPYSKFDPQWIDYLKRHPELGAANG